MKKGLIFLIMISLMFILSACSEYGIPNYEELELPQYEVVYDTLGGTVIPSDLVEVGSMIPIPSNPEKDDYTFQGWFLDEAMMYPFSFGAMPSQDIQLYAAWLENTNEDSLTEVTVSFESNGGSNIVDLVIDSNTMIQALHPTKSGFIFAGWYFDEDLLYPLPYQFYSTEDITLYAKWNEMEITVLGDPITISFDSNGGSLLEDVIHPYNTIYSPSVSPILEGHTFGGWYFDEELLYQIPISNRFSEDITLYAKWVTNEYTIRFNNRLGEMIQQSRLRYGDPIQDSNIPEIPSRTGFSIVGWDIEIPELIESNLVIAPLYSINQYTVTYYKQMETTFDLVIPGDHFTVCQTSEGAIFGFGNQVLNPISMSHLFDFEEGEHLIQGSSGYQESIAVSNLGNVYLWRQTGDGYSIGYLFDDPYQPLNITNTFDLNIDEKVVEVKLSDYEIFALTNQGRMFMFGDNTTMLLGTGSSNPVYTPINVNTSLNLLETENIIEFDVAERQVIIATDSNRLFAWGMNDLKQLGLDSPVYLQLPTEITSQFTIDESDEIKIVACSSTHAIVTTKFGKIYGFGRNANHELFVGLGAITSIPYDIEIFISYYGITSIIDVDISDYITFFTTSSGIVYSTGKNDMGQLNTTETVSESIYYALSFQDVTLEEGEKISNVIASPSGGYFITNLGHLYAWGLNNANQFGGFNGSSTTPVEIKSTLPVTYEIHQISTLDYNDPLLLPTMPDLRNYAFAAWGTYESVEGQIIFVPYPSTFVPAHDVVIYTNYGEAD